MIGINQPTTDLNPDIFLVQQGQELLDMGVGRLIETASLIIIGLICLWIVFTCVRSINFVPQQWAYVIEHCGKYSQTWSAGLNWYIPFFQWVAYKHDLREIAIAEEPQECFTKDNVRVQIDGVIYMSVNDPVKASYGVTNYKFAAKQLAQTTTRAVIGKIDLDRTFEERETISAKVVEVLSEAALNWGITVHRYEVKNLSPPASVTRSMEKQMTAERERRAMIARAEGERQAKINDSEGRKEELINKSMGEKQSRINKSLGEKQRRINEAEGRANEIRSIALATAESIKKIADAVADGKGDAAVRMRIAQQYLKQFNNLAKNGTKVVLPTNLADFSGLLKSFELDDPEK